MTAPDVPQRVEGAGHWHCLDGCEKAQGELQFGGHKLVCVNCGAPFVPCTPETCPALSNQNPNPGGNRP